MTHSYYIDKRTGTSADTVLAAGFARLIQKLLQVLDRPSDDVWLIDDGPYYRIETMEQIRESDLDLIEQHNLVINFIQHLDTATQSKVLGTHYGKGFDYDGQKHIRDMYREKRRALPSKARTPEAFLTNDPDLQALHDSIQQPDTELPLYLVINQMKVTSSYNEPVIRWRELPPTLLRQHIALLFSLFEKTPNPVDTTVIQWKKLAKSHKLGEANMTMLQVINPTTGKGANYTKANKLSIGGLDEFWLIELLKFAGFFMLAHPQTISDSKDRKTYVLRPRHIQVSMIDELIWRFREVLWSSTPAKLDVLAVLMFTRVLIQHEREALKINEGERPPFASIRPADRIHGFDIAFYKDMGSASAVMNVANLNLPQWIPPVETLEIANKLMAMLKEHTDVIQSIRTRNNEERTEEFELLRRYRDFLSGRDIDAFLDFASLFATYISQKIDRGEYYIRRFHIHSLKELITMIRQDYMEVVDNQGFQNIADAIRRSTVSLQYAKGMGQRPGFDIRYGLARELVRRSNDADGFMSALSEFVTLYNNETAQTFETSKGALGRKRISEDDLASVVGLLSKGFKAKTLAQMLTAFGSAKTSSDPIDPDKPVIQDEALTQGE